MTTTINADSLQAIVEQARQTYAAPSDSSTITGRLPAIEPWHPSLSAAVDCGCR
eukprot:m.82950 g.82950  ORF g.82950 m.82950 type:complete len:54 (-) comp14638_c0_seq11:2622-2783(-)